MGSGEEGQGRGENKTGRVIPNNLDSRRCPFLLRVLSLRRVGDSALEEEEEIGERG